MQNVLLASTLHDPKGVLLGDIPVACDVLLQNYYGWVVNVTSVTDQRVKDALKNRGVIVSEVDKDHPIVADPIENDHMQCLAEAYAYAQRHAIGRIQYTDGDRMIMAAVYYPKDVADVASFVHSDAMGSEKSYLNLRRSTEDYMSHHPPLVETELEFNRLYSKAFGMPLDIGSTAHCMTIDVIANILERASTMESVSFPHPKWLIIAKEMGADIGSVETHNVLTFETSEQRKKDIEKRVEDEGFMKVSQTEARVPFGEGSRNVVIQEAVVSPLTSSDLENDYHLLQQADMATYGKDSLTNPIEWRLRFSTADQYLSFLQLHLGNINRDEKLAEEIRRSRGNLERRRDMILGFLALSEFDRPSAETLLARRRAVGEPLTSAQILGTSKERGG